MPIRSLSSTTSTRTGFCFFALFLGLSTGSGWLSLFLLVNISKKINQSETKSTFEPPPFVSAAQFFVQYRLTYFCCFSSLFYFFFFFFVGGGRPGTFFRCNAFNAFSSITFFGGGGGGRSGTFFR